MVHLGLAHLTVSMSNSHFVQLLRYGIVGLSTNALGYLLYLGLTALGMGPKLAMSLLYIVGVLQTFVFNRSWTFAYAGAGKAAFRRHVTLYAVGYGLNLLTLAWLVDTLHFQHQWVMAGMVVFMAVFFFSGQKFWVFRQSHVAKLGG